MKKTKEDIVLGTIKYICIAALLIVVLFPIIWLVAGSFKLEKEILSFPPTVFGEHFSMKSFQRIFDAIPFLQYIANTVILPWARPVWLWCSTLRRDTPSPSWTLRERIFCSSSFC